MTRTFFNRFWDRWANLHPFLRFVIAVSVLALIAFLTVKPSYRIFREWRLDRNLANAQVAVDAVRMDEARDLSLTVLRAGDPRIEAFRILEKAMASLQDPRHAYVARALLSHPDGSAADRLNGFLGLAPSAPLGIVAQSWAALPAEDQQDPRFVAAFGDRLIEENRLDEAASLLMMAEPPDAAIRLHLIRVLIASGSREALEEAQQRIVTEWPEEPTEFAPWIGVLETLPAASLNGGLLTPIRLALDREAPADDAAAALMLARIDYSSRFSERGQIIEKAVTSWRTRAPLALARFLADLGLDERLVAVLPPTAVAEHPALLPLLARAMQRTENWEAATELLESHGQTLPRWEWHGWHALIFRRTGRVSESNDAWAAALEEAKTSPRPEACLELHRFARDSKLLAEAERALVEAIRRGRGPLPLYADLKPLLESLAKQHRENELIQICAIYLPFEPGNPVLLTQYAYLACLNDLAEPATLIAAIDPLAAAFPAAVPIQCVLATLHLSAGEPAAAAEILGPLNLEPSQLEPGYRAAYEVAQVMNGRLALDDPRIQKFPWKELLPSERRKFTRLLKLQPEAVGLAPADLETPPLIEEEPAEEPAGEVPALGNQQGGAISESPGP